MKNRRPDRNSRKRLPRPPRRKNKTVFRRFLNGVRTQFKPGNPGGPGRPRGSTAEVSLEDIKTALSSIFECGAYYTMVRRKAVAGKLPGPVWRFYLEHLHGKPTQTVQHGAHSLLDLLSAFTPDEE